MKRGDTKIKKLLPYSRQFIDGQDIKEVSNVLKEDFITQGPRINSFEKNFAEYVGAKFAVACATGTAALHLSCQAMKLGPGKKLLTSPITFVATANCAQFVGADTHFADIDLDTFCISIEALKKALTKLTILYLLACMISLKNLLDFLSFSFP